MNPTSKFGDLGPTVEDAKKTGFFTWFHLEQTASRPGANGRTILDFQPSGEKFHNLAKFRIECDAQSQAIASLELILSRAFIESRGNGPFAADIAKSLLLASISEADAGIVGPIAREIEARAYSAGQVIVGPGYERPDLPETPSAAFLAYTGKRPAAAFSLSDGTLRFRNQTIDGVPSLIISMDGENARGGFLGFLRGLFSASAEHSL